MGLGVTATCCSRFLVSEVLLDFFRGFENQKPNRQIPDGLDAIGARR